MSSLTERKKRGTGHPAHGNGMWPRVVRGDLRETSGLQTCVCAHLLSLYWPTQDLSRKLMKKTLEFNPLPLNILNQALLKCVVPGTVGKLKFKPLSDHPQGKACSNFICIPFFSKQGNSEVVLNINTPKPEKSISLVVRKNLSCIRNKAKINWRTPFVKKKRTNQQTFSWIL